MPGRFHVRQRYTRSDPRGLFPRVTGRPALPHNRLAAFWRPVVDLADSEVASLRLRMIRPVSTWLADPEAAPWPWFSRMGLPGVRRQVVRHAGLDPYDCADPRQLPGELRTPRWETLVAAVDGFAALGHRARTLLIFHLAQLSYHPLALRLAGPVRPDGDPERDRYVYEVARVRAGSPGQVAHALSLFEELAGCGDPQVALAACFQGIGHALRHANDLTSARRFEERGRELAKPPDDWHACLVFSRFHRAVALLRLTEGDPGAATSALTTAKSAHDDLAAARRPHDDLAAAQRAYDAPADPAPGGTDSMIVRENRRYLLELELDAETRGGSGSRTVALCQELLRLDPYCVHARLRAGDGFAAAGDLARAARWYERAGELGTGAGATGWFRAAQCHDHLGDLAAAVNAMGRCLELDATAVEPREYLAG
ncbi:hypothetical protein AB0M50_11005 [Nonomuraea fuscirosea]|uniref:hypothetical protein n=1 Tax=Nonomuraea fuscirosea TaxID=1291556 RepID=UPI0034227B30